MHGTVQEPDILKFTKPLRLGLYGLTKVLNKEQNARTNSDCQDGR
jgi:hypothetical protein